MKFNLAAITLFSLCLTIPVLGQQARLEGYVYEIVKDKEVPVSDVKVISPDGQSQETDSKGHFVINFPNSVRPGKATRIEVGRSGWLVRDPLFGECTTKDSSRNVEVLKVIVVPKGSPLALEPKQLSKVIARWADERAKLRGRVKELGLQLDEYAFLREYAEKYGVTLDQFKDAADRWAKRKESDDKEERALKEYWQKNYESAARLAREAGDDAVEELVRLKNEQIVIGHNAIRRYRLEGNSFFQQYKFKEAVIAYNKIENLFTARTLAKNDFQEEWAETKLLVGNAKSELGTRVEGRESQSLIAEALTAYHEALDVYTREQLPQDWAATQNNLGNTLQRQGERAEGSDSLRLLGEAAQAFRDALKVYTREQFPQQWAMAQNNLGVALRAQGERAEGSDSLRLLGEAAQACRDALKVSTREQFPQLWAMAQDNLGVALGVQGHRVDGPDGLRLLGEAAQACREALKVFTREQLPQDWAVAQNNLGAVLTYQGERTEGSDSVRLLGEAVTAFREALKVRTREQLPQDWAATQHNLGNALHSQGERAEGAEGMMLLGEAVSAYREALKVRTREQFPQDWAVTQNNLSIALRSQGERAEGLDGVRLLSEAVTACREALKVFTREQLPQQWAMAQDNLGAALRLQGERAAGFDGLRLLGEAVTAYRETLKVRTREQLPQDWAMTQGNLGNALQRQGELTEGSDGLRLLGEAVQAYRDALKVYTREELPQQWAATQTNLGAALTLQGKRAAGSDNSLRLLGEAVTAFREALTVYTREQLPRQWVIAQNYLARAYFLLRNWFGAAAAYTNILTLYPDNEEAYTLASALYHDVLFKFETAFSLNQQWLTRHSDNLSAQADFAEKHFTTARFDECERRINSLLAKPAVSASTKSALRAIEIADLLALNQTDKIPAKIELLAAEVARQPAEFKVEWVFDGTKHFIAQNEKLSSYRDWLGSLFDALAGKDRETILGSLQKVGGSFR